MVTGKVAHAVDHPAAGDNIMSPSTQASLPELLAKLEDMDPNCRKSSLEAIKELMQKDIVHHEDSMANFLDIVLGTLDKKSKHSSLVSSSDQCRYSQLAHSSASLLAVMAHHATHEHLRLSPHNIASIVKHLVSWFPLDLGTGSQSHSLHQACSKLVSSLAENAALHVSEDITQSTCSSPSSFSHCSHDTSDQSNDSSTSSSSRNINENPSDQQHCALAMESLCRPLITALCNKVEPISRGATTCLEALVSMESWSFASPSLIEELCFRAVSVMQERTVLSTSVAQISLLCNLAKKNHESLSCFRAGLLKKGVDILLNNGAWQQRVAAARMLECLLSMGSDASMGNKHDKQAVVHAIEALEHCKRDKVAMVRSAVIEALKKTKLQHGLDISNALSATPGQASTSGCSSMKASKVDYRKRRRKKPSPSGPFEKQPAFSSPALSRRDALSGNDKWISRVTPSSGWSSSDSVNSSVDVKCPRKKVARTAAWNGKTNESGRRKEQSSPASLSAATAPSLSSSCRAEDMTNRCPSLRPCSTVKEKCNSCATPTHIVYNPIAQLDSLEEAEIHQSATKPDGDLSTPQISLLLPELEHTKLQYTDVLEGFKRIELLNDVAWNVRNNPIATDDSELDSPRPTVFDSCSIVYCADGDDDNDADVNIQVRQSEVEENHPVHAREHQKCDDVNKTGRQPDFKDVHAREHQQGACQRWLLQDSSAENCILKGNEGHCTPGSCTLSTEDGGISDDAAIMDTINLQNQMSNHEVHVDDPHSLLAIHEHEGIGDNFDVLTHFNDTCQALYEEAEWESSRAGHQLEGRVEDMQALKPAYTDMESVQACSLEKRFPCGEEDECRGDPGEESGNSVVGWLRECYVVKKVGAFGILFLGLAIPLAIVSIINTFDTKEEASDFLVPT